MEIILLWSPMPSLPPSDCGASVHVVGIRAIGQAITVVSMPHSANDTSKTDVFLDEDIDATVNGVIVILPHSTNSRG
jgi:hypothetical protein